MPKTKGNAPPLVRKKRRKKDPERRSASVSVRTKARRKRIAEILERTRKGLAFLEELARGAEPDDTPVWQAVVMPPEAVAPAVEVGDEMYQRLVAEAARRNTTPEYVADLAINRALNRADQESHEQERARNTTVVCSCCGGRCKQPLLWRGRTRCGCPNGDRPDHIASGKSSDRA